MKRLLMQLAGWYAGAGALSFLLYRARYLHTSELRRWTDDHGLQVAELLDSLKTDLTQLREATRVPASNTGKPAFDLANDPAGSAPIRVSQWLNQNRRPVVGAPEGARLAA